MSALTRRQFLGAAAGVALVSNGIALPARGLTINPRSSWATDRPPKGPLAAEDVEFLIVHHSASRNGHTGADAPAILRSFYDYHTSAEKGWNDIAYNFLIDADGGIWEGRAGSLDGPVAGDATGGNQGYTQLVCIIGDYNTVQPSPASLSSLVSLLAWLADRYDVSTSPGAKVAFVSRGSNLHAEGTEVVTPTITGHRTMSRTTCPGDNLNAYVVGGLTADVEAVRGGAAIPASPTSTTSSTSPTTSITTTTLPATTTTLPATTTTTTLPSSTTTPVPTTSWPSTSLASSTTTLPVSSASSPPGPTTTPPVAAGETARPLPSGILATAGAIAATGAGLVVWRQRRMNGRRR